MIHLDRRTRLFAIGLSAVAGYADAVGFLSTGGYFVAFMSGNTTRLAVALASGSGAWRIALALILGFVGGVVAGAFLGRLARARRGPAVLVLTALTLAMAAMCFYIRAQYLAVVLVAAAMGMENTVFAEQGDVRIGLTYMTGALVKFGKRLTVAFLGEDPLGWAPYLGLWLGLVCGAVIGVFAYRLTGAGALAAAACSMLVFAWIAAPLKIGAPTTSVTAVGAEA